MIKPTVTVIMPVYNTQKYVKGAVLSVLEQTFMDFELLIIDDQGTDNSVTICKQFTDPRVRIISQQNRGLAGARNTGIRQAAGKYIALIDSDDLWHPEKLERHVYHLDQDPEIGISYAASRMIDDNDNWLSIVQRPKLTGVNAATIFLRNPIGNGSAPVIRRDVFGDIAHYGARANELNYFDETFRQSEDIECWTRIALTTSWTFEGIPGELTYYRVNEGGLSANVIRQFEAWLRVRDKVRTLAPQFSQTWEGAAEAYQLRYLARRSVRMLDRGLAIRLALKALQKRPQILFAEPVKTISTLAAATCLRCLPERTYAKLQTRLMGA